MLTIAQAFANYKAIIAESDMDMTDNIALCEGWNNYSDSLCKDGELTNLQYHYCPAYDDLMPDDDLGDDIEHILQAMGVRFNCRPIGKRHDSLMSDMPGASHWLCTFDRDSKGGFDLEFTQGAAHKSAPDELTVLGCLMSADWVDESEFNESDFEHWCDSLGYESDSRKAESIYRACIEQSKAVRDCFTASEIDDLRELLSEAGY